MREEILTSAFKKLKARIVGIETVDDDVKDSLQEAFCRLWSKKETITDSRQAEGMLSVAARNARIDMIRRRKTHPETGLDGTADMPDENDRDEYGNLYKKVEAIIKDSLSDRDREILLRRERDGWEFEEIAEYYSISEANARMITARCRKKVRDIYKNKEITI